MIERVNSKEQLNTCLEIIHKSFITVADEFGLTEENCPNHTAFMPIDKLIKELIFNIIFSNTDKMIFIIHKLTDTTLYLKSIKAHIHKNIVNNIQFILSSTPAARLLIFHLRQWHLLHKSG